MARRSRSPSSAAISAASGSGPVILRADLVEILDEGQRLGALALEPGQRRVAHHRQPPRARLQRRRRLQRGQRADRRLLHDVLRVGAVAAHPFGEPIGVVEMGEHDLAEPAFGGVFRHACNMRPHRP